MRNFLLIFLTFTTFCSLIIGFFDRSASASFISGSFIMIISASLLGISWFGILRKKLVALNLFIIVSKYGILSVAIYFLLTNKGINLPWFLVGLSSLLPAALIFALLVKIYPTLLHNE